MFTGWPRACQERRGDASSTELQRAIINQRINREIRPKTHQEHWGVVDRWDYPEDGYGDCEDYQLIKRKLLIAAGLPRRAMRRTVVLDKNGGGHAVLMILTSPWLLRPRQ